LGATGRPSTSFEPHLHTASRLCSAWKKCPVFSMPPSPGTIVSPAPPSPDVGCACPKRLLQVSAMDSPRHMVHVHRGKGAKDRPALSVSIAQPSGGDCTTWTNSFPAPLPHDLPCP